MKLKKRIKVANDFFLDEFVNPEDYSENAINLIDENLIKIVQFIRTKLNKPLKINDWANGGRFKESGLRGPGSKVGSKFSAHKKGKAADLKGVAPKELYDFVKANSSELYAMGLRRIEDISITPTWFHIDTWDKNGTKGIEVVDLKKVVEIIKI